MTYTVRGLWRWFPADGLTLGRIVFLRRLDDAQTLAHELVHVRQQAAHPVWFWVSYLFLAPRAKLEAEAFAESAGAGNADWSAGMLSSWRYGWPCRRATAKKLILEWAAKGA
jgi:hypothetical protein